METLRTNESTSFRIAGRFGYHLNRLIAMRFGPRPISPMLADFSLDLDPTRWIRKVSTEFSRASRCRGSDPARALLVDEDSQSLRVTSLPCPESS